VSLFGPSPRSRGYNIEIPKGTKTGIKEGKRGGEIQKGVPRAFGGLRAKDARKQGEGVRGRHKRMGEEPQRTLRDRWKDHKMGGELGKEGRRKDLHIRFSGQHHFSTSTPEQHLSNVQGGVRVVAWVWQVVVRPIERKG